MKNIIKQIEKIKGVVTVEKAGENMAVVVFEPNKDSSFTRITQDEFLNGFLCIEAIPVKPKPELINVICDTETQWEFVKTKGANPVTAGLIYQSAISMSEFIRKYDCGIEWVLFENNAVRLKESSRGCQYVECTTEKEFEYIKKRTGYSDPAPFDSWVKFPCVEIHGANCFSSDMFPERSHRIIDFCKYVSNYNLQGEWDAFNKPKSLSPDELVDGKIYVDEDNGRVVRFNKIKNGCAISLYSQKCIEGTYYNSLNGYGKNYHYRGLFRHATPSEAQSLIRAEIEHGYFHELRDAK